MERIFLIGGSGFIGKNFTDLYESKYEIHIFDRYIDEEFFSHYPSVKTVLMDLVDGAIPDEYVSPDYIINLASIINTGDDISLFDQLISSNLKVLINLYKRFQNDRNLKLFIQFGSSEEYGNIKVPFEESMREEPTTPYALVKQLTVNTAIMLHRNFCFPSMAVRPGNLFGRFQNNNRFIPYIITQLSQNKPLDVSLCEQKRDFMYCNDFVKSIDSLICNHESCVGEIVNVSSGESIKLKDIIDFSKNYIQSTSAINYGAKAYKKNEIMDLNCSVVKLTKLSKLEPNHEIYAGLKECINFYTDNNI